MAIKVLMPALSPTMKVGTLARWIKKEGDNIKPGEIIAEIETDKATMEVESADSGTLARILIPEKTQGVKVNELIAVLLEKGEGPKDADALIAAHKAVAPAPQANVQEPETKVPSAPTKPTVAQAPSAGASAGRIFATPLAKRIAAERGVNLGNVAGSGPKGRIVRDDVLNFKGAIRLGGVSRNPQEYKVVEMTQMRKTIAARLQESKSQIPHFYLTIDCDATELSKLRDYLNAKAKVSDGGKPEYKVSINDLVIKAIAVALSKVPEANAGWVDDAIVRYNNVDISVAVATQDGLITPIIQNADQKHFVHISNEMKELGARAKANQLKAHEFMGGSFTVSNLGMYGVREFQAIINPPQACILAVGALEARPVVRNGIVQAGLIMTVSISCDHRVVDGAIAARLMQVFKEHIEQPISMFV